MGLDDMLRCGSSVGTGNMVKDGRLACVVLFMQMRLSLEVPSLLWEWLGAD